MGGVQAVAASGCFSAQLDVIPGPPVDVALGDHLAADVSVATEGDGDQLVLPRLEVTVHRQDVEHLQTHGDQDDSEVHYLTLVFYIRVSQPLVRR